MEALRQILTSKTNHLEITLPDNMVNIKLEVIIISLGEPKKNKKSYNSLMGTVSENEARKMLEYVESSRNEWE